jgi:hypothetical protein
MRGDNLGLHWQAPVVSRATGRAGAERIFEDCGDGPLARIGVIYLCRFAEGERPVRAFVDSYRAHSAGLDHDLHVIFKGFRYAASLATAQALFGKLPIHSIELADKGYDIGSYFSAARLVANPRLIFFNTFTALLAEGWLKKFDDALNLPGVGLVGATGSWQSHRSLYEVSLKRALRSVSRPVESLNRLRTELQDMDSGRDRPSAGTADKVRQAGAPRILRRFGASLYRLLRFDHFLVHYAPYPNPHIRTNAFMIERDRFLALQRSSFRTKMGVYKFESGRQSLTQQILAQNLRPVVVDRNGLVYDMADWKSSSTYWIGQQANLIAADNRTRDYSEGSQQIRADLQAHAWEHPASWSTERWISARRRA